MKKNIIVALLLAGFSVFAGTPDNVTVSTSSLQLVPTRPIKSSNTDSWVTGTAYSAGSVVKNGVNYYFTVAGGTSGGSAPTHTSGTTSDGGVSWRYITPGARSGVAICVVTSGGSVNLSFGKDDAVVDKGGVLKGTGHWMIFSPSDNFQGAIHAVRSGGSDTVVGVQEF